MPCHIDYNTAPIDLLLTPEEAAAALNSIALLIVTTAERHYTATSAW